MLILGFRAWELNFRVGVFLGFYVRQRQFSMFTYEGLEHVLATYFGYMKPHLVAIIKKIAILLICTEKPRRGRLLAFDLFTI